MKENKERMDFALEVDRIKVEIEEKVERVKQKARTWHEEMIKERAIKIELAKNILAENTRIIQQKHETIKKQLSQESVSREVNITVNRGLESLEKFIQVLRETNMEEDMMRKAINDPTISNSIASEAKKVITSDFFKSLQAQIIMQTEFINIVAHELRTPIMPILLSVDNLEAKFGKNNEEVAMIGRNAKRLLRLTENILDVTKIESKSLKLNKEPFDLNELILNCIKDEHIQVGKKIVIDHQTNVEKIIVEADRDRISQVISNLLHNAIKFTTRGTIWVKSVTRNDDVLISIRDNGPGIDNDLIPILFTKFVTKSVKGTGLGLYISKNILEMHGGRIWGYNSKSKNEGATFVFILPLNYPK